MIQLHERPCARRFLADLVSRVSGSRSEANSLCESVPLNALVVISGLTPGFVGYPEVKFYGRGRGHAVHVVSLAAQSVS